MYVHAGRYKLATQLVVNRSGIVLRGAGKSQTTLFFSKSLTDLFGQTWSGEYSGDMAHSDWKNAPGGWGKAWKGKMVLLKCAAYIDKKCARWT